MSELCGNGRTTCKTFPLSDDNFRSPAWQSAEFFGIGANENIFRDEKAEKMAMLLAHCGVSLLPGHVAPGPLSILAECLAQCDLAELSA